MKSAIHSLVTWIGVSAKPHAHDVSVDIKRVAIKNALAIVR